MTITLGSAVQPRRIVLVLTAPPIPFGTAAARWYNVLLKGLVERGHRVTALTPFAERAEAVQALDLFPAPAYDLRCYPYAPRSGPAAKWESLRRPSSYLFSSELRANLAGALGGDRALLHLEHNWSGWLGRGYTGGSVLAVNHLVGVDQRATTLRTWAAHVAERRLVRSFRVITTVTPELTERVRTISPRSQVYTVPLAFDLSLYPFQSTAPSRANPVLGLIGSFAWEPTWLAATRLLERLWPEIRRQIPEARLLIVGRRARRALRKYTATPGVEVIEDVPDTAPYFRAMDVMLYAPPRGSGMKVKVLEAFAYGTAVVTNGSGAEGIPLRDAVHAGLCEDDAGLVDRVVGLLRDSAARERQRVAARQLIEEHCHPDRALDLLEKVYAVCV